MAMWQFSNQHSEISNSAVSDLLPIFPLPSVVLFPGVFLPLHIFEPRYRLMVKRCLESSSPFGIIRSSGGQFAAVGTIAEIREATRYVDGRWDLVTLGIRRFTVRRLDREAPYLRAEIDELDEPLGDSAADAAALAERVSDGFVEYLDLLRGEDGDDRAHDGLGVDLAQFGLGALDELPRLGDPAQG